LLNKVPIKGRERVMTVRFEPMADSGLQALLAAVRRSPIIWRPIVQPDETGIEWAILRKSAHADAFVLAWIAGHVGVARTPVLM
jgi:hypothetical protein